MPFIPPSPCARTSCFRCILLVEKTPLPDRGKAGRERLLDLLHLQEGFCTGSPAAFRKEKSNGSPSPAPLFAIPWGTVSCSTSLCPASMLKLRQTMRGQIKNVLNGLSKATVIVTHDQLEALTMADRIAIMRDGLIEQGRPPRTRFSPSRQMSSWRALSERRR